MGMGIRRRHGFATLVRGRRRQTGCEWAGEGCTYPVVISPRLSETRMHELPSTTVVLPDCSAALPPEHPGRWRHVGDTHRMAADAFYALG